MWPPLSCLDSSLLPTNLGAPALVPFQLFSPRTEVRAAKCRLAGFLARVLGTKVERH